jgi:hypothetical protein
MERRATACELDPPETQITLYTQEDLAASHSRRPPLLQRVLRDSIRANTTFNMHLDTFITQNRRFQIWPRRRADDKPLIGAVAYLREAARLSLTQRQLLIRFRAICCCELGAG